MKINFIFILLFTICLNVKAQDKVDSLKYAMLKVVESKDSSFIKKMNEKSLFYSTHGKITYQNKKYFIYDFGFEPVLHEPYLYIIFYECGSCDNIILGSKNEPIENIAKLNKIYANSKKFSKKTYVELFDILLKDYLPEKRGKIIDRSKSK
jgi:hypothetical protein